MGMLCHDVCREPEGRGGLGCWGGRGSQGGVVEAKEGPWRLRRGRGEAGERPGWPGRPGTTTFVARI